MLAPAFFVFTREVSRSIGDLRSLYFEGMGSFFANVQVLAPRDLVRERLIAHARAGVYEPAHDESDRGCAMATSGEGWTVVYDQDMDGHDLKSIEELAATLSFAPAQLAVSILVSDSDELVLSLFEEGKRLNRLRVVPGKAVKIGPKWRAAFPKLPAILPPPEAFAEEVLTPIADAMGVSVDSLSGSYEHRDELQTPLEELRFVLKPEYRFIRWAEGPPQFWTPQGSRRDTAAIGRDLFLSATLHNRGGPCRGLSVILLPGEWLELVDVQRVHLSIGANCTTFEAEPQLVEKNGGRAFVVTFEEATLDAWPEEAVAETPWQFRKAQHAYDQTRIWSSIVVTPRRAGSATLRAFFVPREHPRGGMIIDYQLTVTDA